MASVVKSSDCISEIILSYEIMCLKLSKNNFKNKHITITKKSKQTDNMDVVDRILAKPFERLPFEEKLQIKQQGRSTSQIDIVQKIGNHNRSFQPS